MRIPVLPLVLVFLALTTAPACGSPDKPVHRAVGKALKEHDDRTRAIRLEEALSGADGGKDAKTVVDLVLAKEHTHAVYEVGILALATMSDPAVLGVLAKRAQDRSPGVRCRVSEVVGRSFSAWGKSDGARDVVLGLTRDASPSVRAAALAAIGEQQPDWGRYAAERALDDPRFEVRSAGAHALARLGVVGAVPALVRTMRTEDGRLVDDFAAALATLSGEDFGPRPDLYERWWALRKGTTADADAGDWSLRRLAFESAVVRTRSRRILFVLGVGKPMAEPLNMRPRNVASRKMIEAAGEDLGEDLRAAKTKLDLAKVHLRAMIRTLDDGVRFDVMVYSSSATFAFGKLTVADGRTRRRGEGRVQGLSAGGDSNLHGALVRVFDPKAKNPYLVEDGPDTVVIVGDGGLSKPGSEDRLEVGSMVRRLQRARRILFLPVAVGQAERTLLAVLASGPPRGRVVSVP